ncbi:high mobility group box domain-containing protein, partial [Mycena maculata]
IPRPKNSFIIFRTEFARLHRNPRGSRSKTDVKVLGRTVSGKAADAWRELPPEQKQRYQRLAELEKEQHAREHPDYQYRPRRR